MKDNEITTVPVLANFDSSQVIGELRIRTDAIPMVPDFVFSIGINCLETPTSAPGEVPRTPYTGPFELMCVSPIRDDAYVGYLRQVGKLPQSYEEKTLVL